ncbi:MAG: alkaline phosphatase family protein [Candidatus Krumholzibacteria bacterium]|nr:alkaline phosphatase family protein [Candidatus Krumholzibacteria bacterium]
MSRIVVVGVDGMDWQVLQPILQGLPNLREIARSGFAGEMQSIFPPDSIPSWVSIFTGLDPSEHGILESIDYFKKGVRQFAVDTSAFRGRTFWDAASAMGKKVIVVNPLLAYPPWNVNGIMVSGPVFVSGESGMTPRELRERYDLPPLGGIVDFPDRNELTAFAEKSKAETRAIVDLAVRLLEHEQWDLSFVTLLTLDRIFHFFWRYQDVTDPTHPRRSAHAGVIADFHLFIDDCVGRIIRAAGPDAMLLIVSDHGHGMRPTLHFNVNQLLLEKGLLTSRIRGPKALSARYHIDRAKNSMLDTLHRLDLEDISYRVARVLPWTRKLKKGDFLTERSENLATASDFGGNNPFGGIDVSRKICAERNIDYETLRDKIIAILMDAKGNTGERVFLWARRREEIYSGKNIEKFPDILYEMDSHYGTSWSLYRPLVTVNPRHRKISGGHRKTGVMLVGPLGGRTIRREAISPLNIGATVINVLSEGASGPSPQPLAEVIPGTSFLERH